MRVVFPCTQNLMDSAHPHAVLSKLNEQRLHGLFCDITIVVEDVKFRAHKNILAACSGYFRNALTAPNTWSSGQVLELMDLKSEVFASILNFIYCSTVTLHSAGDTVGLVAAGKRLGIPFLEKLAEQEKQDDDGVKVSPGPVSTNIKTVPRPEDMDGSRGPRITNAFSITEDCPGDNLFAPLVQSSGQRQSPDVGELPSSCPKTSCLSGNNETTQALSEHSYAVNKSTESKDSGQSENRKLSKPAILQSKMLFYKNTGPLKKRHKLRGILGKTILSTQVELQTDKEVTTSTDSNIDVEVTAPRTPPPLFSEGEGGNCETTSLITNSSQTDLGPPTLSPHREENISIYSCEHCPEIFANNALLAVHSEVHKKGFVSHLFCKFCHRKFIHLKRLRNHEQLCRKAARTSPAVESQISVEETDHSLGDGSSTKILEVQPNTDLLNTLNTEPPIVDSPWNAKAVRPAGTQRKYNCSVCKRVYVTLSSLKRHENVHSWQRAYPCHYCNKVFALAEYRTKHEIWHTGERRYQCIFCLETFMTYYILKNHQKSFHGIDPNLSVKKKSANGGLKASVYPIKLYRLLPMKFRKRQYKTYSHTFSESTEGGDQASLDNNLLMPLLEENRQTSQPDAVALPLTFMATTKTVAPVIPRISFGRSCDQEVDQTLNSELETETRDSTIINHNVLSTQHDLEICKNNPSPLINSDHCGQNVALLNSLNTVKKLGELSASGKKVENMKKLLRSTANVRHDKFRRSKTETYIAKPVCPGPSMNGDTIPLCQITVKIGNEAIIRRQIKGSKLFPKKKMKVRDVKGIQRSGQCHRVSDSSESLGGLLKPDVTPSTRKKLFDGPNDCDTADVLWRPYYSYKAKKKRKRLRLKQRKALFHQFSETLMDQASAPTEAQLDRGKRKTEKMISGSDAEVKLSLNLNSPRATYCCDICDSSFITKTGLRAHVIGSHPCFCCTCGKQGPPGEAPAGGDYICNSCMESGSCFDNSTLSPNPEKKYCCSFCPQRFLYLATKRSHEKKHQTINEERYSYDITASPKYLKDHEQKPIKTEDMDYQGCIDIKREKEEDGQFPIDTSNPKMKDNTEMKCVTTYQDVTYPNIKSSLSPCHESLVTAKVKHGMGKKRLHLQSAMHYIVKEQACRRDSNSNRINMVGPRTSSQSDHDKTFRKDNSKTKSNPVFVYKPDEWVCKDEPFF